MTMRPVELSKVANCLDHIHLAKRHRVCHRLAVTIGILIATWAAYSGLPYLATFANLSAAMIWVWE